MTLPGQKVPGKQAFGHEIVTRAWGSFAVIFTAAPLTTAFCMPTEKHWRTAPLNWETDSLLDYSLFANSIYSVVAKSLDVVVLLKLLLAGERRSYAQLSKELSMSASEVHASVRRGIEAGLIDAVSRLPLRKPMEEYLLHGVRYAFPAKPGPLARGIPTAHAAPPLAGKITSDDVPPVWPDPEGTVRGYSIEPLYSSVPKAARADAVLYELLALVDAIRVGRARERNLAQEELKHRLSHAHAA